MDPQAVKAIVEEAFPGDQVLVQGEGCNFQLTVVSERFEGVSPVKKQQMVYACLNEYIHDGSIHAVAMKTYTPAQYAALAS